MSHEKHIVVHEKHETTHLSSEQLKAHHEQLEKARHEQLEKTKSNERDELQKARSLAENEAQSTNEIDQPVHEQPQTERHNTKEDKDHAFRSVMHHVRKDLSASERTFSKFIHQPAIEKTSEVVGKTVARPSGVIGATILATIGLLTVYGIAKFAGFQLSGSEMPLLLVVGFVLGLLVEWGYKAVRTLLLPSKS